MGEYCVGVRDAWDCCEHWACVQHADLFFYRTQLPLTARITRASLYGAQVFLSFFLMLVFMTYNVRSHLVSITHCLTELQPGLPHPCHRGWCCPRALRVLVPDGHRRGIGGRWGQQGYGMPLEPEGDIGLLDAHVR